MKKILLFLLCIGMVGALTGCGSTIGDIKLKTGESGFVIKEDGSMLYAVSESFEKEYYDKKDLEKAIKDEAKAYNESSVASVIDAITVDKIKVSGDEALMVLEFATIYDCSTYVRDYNYGNEGKFYIGTISANPYGISSDMVSLDGKETIKAKDIKKMDAEIVIIDGVSKFQIEGKILYTSENCKVSEDGIVTTADLVDGTSYIVFMSE